MSNPSPVAVCSTPPVLSTQSRLLLGYSRAEMHGAEWSVVAGRAVRLALMVLASDVGCAFRYSDSQGTKTARVELWKLRCGEPR